MLIAREREESASRQLDDRLTGQAQSKQKLHDGFGGGVIHPKEDPKGDQKASYESMQLAALV